MDRLYEEIAFIAYYFHWDHEQIINLEHQERERYCSEISRINSRLNSDTEKKNIFSI